MHLVRVHGPCGCLLTLQRDSQVVGQKTWVHIGYTCACLISHTRYPLMIAPRLLVYPFQQHLLPAHRPAGPRLQLHQRRRLYLR